MSNQFCIRGHDTLITGRYAASGCKICVKLDAEKRKKADPDYQRKWRQKNPAKCRERDWRLCGIKNPDGSDFLMVDYDRLYQMQQGRCKLCKKHISELKHTFAVDHSHVTNVVRGLLCRECNMMLGLGKDNCNTFLAAVEYIKQNLVTAI